VTDVRKALEAEREMEREFVAEATRSETAPKGWPAALNLFHICMWRERLLNNLKEVRDGRPFVPPPDNVDEVNDSELAGGLGVSLSDIAERSDTLLASMIDLYEAVGERPFEWYQWRTTTEAVLGNSYVHPHNHLVAYLTENGDLPSAVRLLERSTAELRKAAAPPTNLGVEIYNLACLRVAEGNLDDALSLIEQSVAIRPTLKDHAPKDADLAPLYDNPRFQVAIKS
jgi:hypothetical protein